VSQTITDVGMPKGPGRPRKEVSGHRTGTAEAAVYAHERPQAAIAPRLFNLHAAAAYLSMSPWTIRDLEAAGVLPRVRVPCPGVESCGSCSSIRPTWTGSSELGRRRSLEGRESRASK
jgi:hypothetical protein